MDKARIANYFDRHDWIVQDSRLDELAPTMNGAVVHCGDGRPSTEGGQKNEYGPNVFGGALGLAALIALNTGQSTTSAGFVMQAIGLIHQSGFSPGMHDCEGEISCGQQILVLQGSEIYPHQNFLAQEVMQLVLDSGGVHVHLLGHHEEIELGINMIPNTTRVPDGKAFHVDAWWLMSLGIQPMVIMETARLTVEALSNVRKAVIYS